MEKEEETKICPVCGSADLYYEAGETVGSVYHCKDCGYTGSLVIEANEEMAQAIKDEYAKKED